MSAIPLKKRYVSPSRSRDVEVGLEEFSDSEIREEFEHRRNKVNGIDAMDAEAEPVAISAHRLREVRSLMLSGRLSEAIRATSDLIRDTLGTAL